VSHFDTLKKNKSNANENNSKIIVLHERKSFNYGNAVRSARRTEHYSTCCNSLILLVITEWILTIIQKKDYYDSLDTISATFIGLVNVAISAVLK
jgi:hypothetical protein